MMILKYFCIYLLIGAVHTLVVASTLGDKGINEAMGKAGPHNKQLTLNIAFVIFTVLWPLYMLRSIIKLLWKK